MPIVPLPHERHWPGMIERHRPDKLVWIFKESLQDCDDGILHFERCITSAFAGGAHVLDMAEEPEKWVAASRFAAGL